MKDFELMVINFGDAFKDLRAFHKDPPAMLYTAIKQLLYLESRMKDKTDSTEIMTILERIMLEENV